jgi:RNA polymerase sigma-70 factor (ECF subfamily)
MPEPGSFVDWMARLQAGDPDAAREVFNRFAQRLIALARVRLDARLRQKVDPEDVLQSVFRSFFTRHAEGQFDLDGWGGLWGLLVVMTLRRCGRRVEYFRTAGRDLFREVAPPAPGDSATAWEGLSREPAPEEQAMLGELVEGLLSGLGGRDRKILELALRGEDARTISAEVGCSERTVQRVLERVRERLEGPSAAGQESS